MPVTFDFSPYVGSLQVAAFLAGWGLAMLTGLMFKAAR